MSTELESLIAEKTRRLHQRQLQEARMGYGTPPEVLMEIEDLKKEIKSLKAQLKADSSRPTPATPQSDQREQDRAQLTEALETCNQRIAALRKDIVRELDSEKKIVLEARLADAKAERNKLQTELDALDG